MEKPRSVAVLCAGSCVAALSAYGAREMLGGRVVAVVLCGLVAAIISRVRKRSLLTPEPPPATSADPELLKPAGPPKTKGLSVRAPLEHTAGQGSPEVTPRFRRRRPPGSTSPASSTSRSPVTSAAPPQWPVEAFVDAAGRQFRSGTHTLTDAQLDARDLLRRLAEAEGLSPVADPQKLSDEDTLTRFLIARKFKPEEALKMLRESVHLRAQLGLDPPRIYHRASMDLGADIIRLLPAFYYGRDRDGYPVYWSKPDPALYKELAARYHIDVIVYWVYCIVERGRELCLRLNVDRWTSVTDLSLVGIRALSDSSVRNIIREQMTRVQKIYPEMIRFSVLYKIPASFEMIRRMISPFLDQRTLDKIRTPSSLSEYVDPAVTPIEFGGTVHVTSDNFLNPKHTGPVDLAAHAMT